MHLRHQARANRDRVVEEPLDDLRPRIGGDVVVFSGDAKNPIAHASTGEVRREALAPQPAEDRERLDFFGLLHSRLNLAFPAETPPARLGRRFL